MAKKSTGAFDFSHFQSVTKDFLMFNKIMALVKNAEILLKCGERKNCSHSCQEIYAHLLIGIGKGDF